MYLEIVNTVIIFCFGFFIHHLIFRALELDCLKNSHPIEVPVGHPSEIDEIFDDISYNKGASVIRMLHRYIGDDDFRKGMNIYLTRHQVNLLNSLNHTAIQIALMLNLFNSINLIYNLSNSELSSPLYIKFL